MVSCGFYFAALNHIQGPSFQPHGSGNLCLVLDIALKCTVQLFIKTDSFEEAAIFL